MNYIATTPITAPQVGNNPADHAPFIIGGFGILVTIAIILLAGRN